MEDPVGRWFLELLFLFFCALLACAQAALTNANESKLRDVENVRAKKLLPLLERREPVIALRGLRTLFLLLFAAIGVKTVQDMGLPFGWAAVVFCLAAAPLVMAFCKLAPEKIGRRRAEATAVLLQPLKQ